MKKSLLLFALVLLLAGCASTGNQAAPAGGTPAGSPSEEPGLTAGAPEKMTCRIVDGAEEGELVLADRKSTRLNSSHLGKSRMPSSA